jgi:multiple sugar transport system substrate-binding protein
MKTIAAPGYLQDVTSIWEAESAGFSQGLRTLYSYNGKAYGAPLLVAPWIIFYNKAIFSQNNLNPPKTWSDFQSLLPVLKSAGVTPMAASTEWSIAWPQTLIVASDAQLWLDLMAGRAKWTDSRVVAAMNIWRDMLDKGYFSHDPTSVHFGNSGNTAATIMVQGKVAMEAMGAWYGPLLASANFNPGSEFGAFICPPITAGAKKGIVVEASPLCVAAHGSHRDESLNAVKYFMSKSGYEVWVKASGNTSARTDVPSTSPVDIQIVSDMKSGGYIAVDRIYEATPIDIAVAAQTQFAKFMLQPGDPTSMLQAIQTKADSVGYS